MPVGPLARQGHEQLARLDETGIDGGAEDGAIGPGEQAPTGEADQVVGRQARRGTDGLRPVALGDVAGDGSTSVTGASVP